MSVSSVASLCLVCACGNAGEPPTDSGARDAAPLPDAAPIDAPLDASVDAGAPFGPPGTLDPRFGVDGIVRGIGVEMTSLPALAVQRDGKILVGGAATVAGGQVMAVVRLNADGTPDAAFGETGIPGVAAFDRLGATYVESVNDVAVTMGGTIVLAGGHPDSDLVVIRLAATGSPDPGFGAGGFYQLAGGGSASAVRVEASGTMTIAGSAGDDGVLVRLTAGGDDDPTFNAGMPLTLVGSGEFRALRVRADGTMLVAGAFPFDGSVVLARFLADGSLDETFGFKGAVRDSGIYQARSLILQGPRIVVCALAGGFVFERFLANGDRDASFGMDGYRLVAPEAFPAQAIEQPDGKILAVGPPGITLARIDADGAPDTTFGTGGTAVASIVGSASALALLPDGRILVGALGPDHQAILAVFFP